MIILMHGIGHGGLGSAVPQGSAAFWIYWLLFILARVSTNCFVMLSAIICQSARDLFMSGGCSALGHRCGFTPCLPSALRSRPGQSLSAVKLLRALFTPTNATGSPRPIF